jgi:3-oxoacyl-[acyl-carrier-protein] synthase-3
MLSDGAGAVLVEAQPRPDRSSLRVDWVRNVSLAHEHEVCMRAGMTAETSPTAGKTWQDMGSAAAAEQAGMMLLRQDTSALPALAEAGLREFESLARQGLIDLKKLDHVLCHYSTNAFRDIVFDQLAAAGADIDTDRWFSNLETRGNTGAASIFIALEECWRTGRFEPGQTVLLAVPESGRFSFAFAHLTCVDAQEPASVTIPVSAPAPITATVPSGGDVHSRLDAVWQDFERRLDQVPVMHRLAEGTATIEDYRRLLFNLRQQVADGARWISRAASNFSVDLFDLRSAAIGHAAEEHRDFMMIERDYAACGGSIDDIRSGEQNIGSEALSAYMFHTASQPDPIGLLGAMFIIEGLGTGKASGWAARFKETLGLRDDQVSFLAYHGEADDDHFAKLQAILASPRIDAAATDSIVKTAKVVARLYALQLEELDHV